MDQTGLIYLRARYYDPSVSRFVQIDNNYNGDKEDVASQNKYVYTLSNPYKYVDKDGNKATTCPPTGVGAVGIGALNYLFMNDKDFKKWIMKKPIWERPTYIANRIVFQAKLKEEQAKPKPNGGSGQNTTTGNGGGSTSNLPTSSKNAVVIICPKPIQTNYSVYANQPVEIRIRESSIKFVDALTANVSTSESFDIKKHKGGNFSDFINLVSLGISGTKYSNIYTTVGFWLIDNLASSAENDAYEYGDYVIILSWSVIRKEVSIKYSNVGYIPLFYLDKDVAGGSIYGSKDGGG